MAGKYLDYDGLSYLWGKLKNFVITTWSINTSGSIATSDNLSGNRIYAGGHAQRIGYVPSPVSGTSSVATGTSWVDTDVGFTLDPGTWGLVASVRFPGTNAGNHRVAWGSGSAVDATRSSGDALSNSWSLDLQTVAIVQNTTRQKYTVFAMQNSGTAKNASVSAYAVRIE